MSCEISVIYPGLEHAPLVLDIPETNRSHGVISFGSDASVCFGEAPGMGGFAIDAWEAEEYGILPRHCALVWAGGVFRLDFDQRAGVYLNGARECARELCNPFEHRTQFTMRLGHRGTRRGADFAPVFQVRRTDLETKKGSLANWLAMRFEPLRRLFQLPYLVRLPMLVLASFIGLIVFSVWNLSQDQYISSALVRADISQEVGQTLAPSVASIGVLCGGSETAAQSNELLRQKPYYLAKGTAWLFEDKDATPWLITNAHVSEQLLQTACERGEDPQFIAYFPGSIDGEIAPAELILGPGANGGLFLKHPLYSVFKDEGAANAQAHTVKGQPKAANVYDLAAYRLSDDWAGLSKRVPLKLPTAGRMGDRGSAASAIAPITSKHVYEPGRSVLMISYPIENIPFLSGGVSGRPFEFRSNIQSRVNAYSREIRGATDTFTPALYSFSGRSAGGISGSPVVSVDGDGEHVLVGIAFSASFIANPPPQPPIAQPEPANEPTELVATPQARETNEEAESVEPATPQIGRTPIGDVVYALDAISLFHIDQWNDPVDPKTLFGQKQSHWSKWADYRTPRDRAKSRFREQFAAQCAADGRAPYLDTQSRSETLNDRLEDGRGVTKIETPSRLQQYTLVSASLPPAERDAFVQMTIKDGPNTQELIGVGEIHYYYDAKAPLETNIEIAAPHGATVTIAVAQIAEGGTGSGSDQCEIYGLRTGAQDE